MEERYFSSPNIEFNQTCTRDLWNPLKPVQSRPSGNQGSIRRIYSLRNERSTSSVGIIPDLKEEEEEEKKKHSLDYFYFS